MISKSDNEIGKFWNRKKSTYRQTGPICKGVADRQFVFDGRL